MRLVETLRRGTWHVFAAAFALTALGAAGVASPVEQGLAAFRSGQFAEAWQSWNDAAAAGDPRGALYVGVLYDTGLGVSANKREAMDWYRRAAQQGSPVGAFNVAVLFDAGLGVSQDHAQAATWYARAAESGYGRAEYNLGMLYEDGTGVTRDRNQAISLFRRAARHGIPAARTHLARLQPVVTGIATPWNQARNIDRDQNEHVTQDRAMQDFQQAQQVLLARGPAEAARAVGFFRQAAERHNPLAEYDLGYCYEHGLGVLRDSVQAYNWYRRAVADASDDSVRSIAQMGVRNLDDEIRQAQLGPARSGRSP